MNPKVLTGLNSKLEKIKNQKIGFWIVVIVIGVIIALGIAVPNFLSIRNILNIFITASTNGLMAIGLTLVMITSGIDLSSPSVMALSAIFGCIAMRATGNTFLGVIVMLAVGVVFGIANGISVSKLRMIPMIVTLAISTIVSGISNWVTDARSVSGLPEIFSDIFKYKLFDTIPVQAIILVAATILMQVILSKTIFGRSLFAIGTNEKAAEVVGINTRKVIFSVYVIAGLFCGVAAILAAAKNSAAGPSLGPQSLFMDVVCAVVLGGTSVSGGKGSVVGTFVGCLFIAAISNVMNLLGIEYFITYIIKGAIIILITFLDVVRNSGVESRNA